MSALDDLKRELKLYEGELTCPTCGDHINEASFRDLQSKKEYLISGMCQVCQDEFFCSLDAGLGPCNKGCCKEEDEY